jgi:CRISPR-associated endonuclease/helicase Cas3
MSRVTEILALLGSLLGNTESHPGKLLTKHLEGVAELMMMLAKQAGIRIEPELLLSVALTHDIGKVHADFQAYLHDKGAGINHAKPSAWFTYSLVHNLWTAEVVCRHHTHLYDVEGIGAEWMLNAEALCKEQQRMASLVPKWPWRLKEADRKAIREFFMEYSDTIGMEKWFEVRTMYSLLVTADRMEAIGVEQLTYRTMPAFQWPVLEPSSFMMDEWRTHVQAVCFAQAKTITKPGVYTLTLPTGAGKTLTGLAIAREWSERLGLNTMVYALPFISIVEQTTQEAKKVFGPECIQEDHSLAYGGQGEELKTPGEVAWRRMSALFRYWREPIILTTLVQLWDALFNSRANHTMNFHRLHNAVIILDEPQTIPAKYWENFGRVLAYISQQCHTYFLLMTATQPHIPAHGELAPVGLTFPYIRHEYKILPEKYQLAALPNLLTDHVPLRQEAGMIVVNRKKIALDVYRLLSAMNMEAEIFFLSGWVTPWRRQRTLKQLKALGKKRHYLVATQVVEAGANLDFGWVFRDLGPLDSIIQVAGRCNRHLNRPQPGIVVVAELLSDTGQPFWQKVYDEVLIDSVKQVLSKYTCFNEQDVPRIIDEYYRLAKETTPEPIFEKLVKGCWNSIPNLIPDDGRDNIMMFVEEDKSVWPIIHRLQTETWDLENRDEKKRLTQQLQQFAIEIPAKLFKNCMWKSSTFYSEDGESVLREIFDGNALFLSKTGIKEVGGLYHPRLGFIPPEEGGVDFNDLAW